jgi:hypothetical protein
MTTPHIPEHWSPEQALAVYEFVDGLLENIWARYATQINLLCPDDPMNPSDDAQLDLFNPNDPLPF